MVYIDKAGNVHNEQPWGMGKVVGMFWGVVNLVFGFFQTLLPIDNTSSSNIRSSGGSSSGGGAIGRGFGFRGVPRGSPRPSTGTGSNVRGLDSYRGPPGPPPACGSCCGG